MRMLVPAPLLLAALLSCASDDPARPARHSDPDTSGTAETVRVDQPTQGAPMTKSFRETAAYSTLLKSEYFEFPWVGRQGEPSRKAVAFEELMSRPDAAEAMAELFNAEHAPQVRLYGLCGMFFTDQANFRDACSEMSRMRVTVDCLKGDLLLSGQPLSTLIKSQDGDPPLVFTSPERAVSQWGARVAEREGGYSLDILHGGLPTGLRVAGSGRRP